MSRRTRWLLAVFATCVALMAAALVRSRSSRRLAPVHAPLAPGSIATFPSSSGAAPVPRPDPSARVAPGPPSMFHLDPARTNRSPFVGPSTPEVAWAFDASSPIETAPAVLADGTIVFGSLAGKLHGVSPAGLTVFAADLHERIYGSPLILRDTIHVGVDAKRFVALSAKGVVRWRLETDGDADTAAAPTPYGAIVFGSGRLVYGVRPDATVLWRFKAGRKVYSSPAVALDGTVYVGSQDNHVHAIDKTGRLRWSADLGSDVDCAPAVGDDGTVFVGVDAKGVVALDANGVVRWRANVGGHVRGGLTLTRNGAVVAGVYGPTPGVVALEAGTGEVRWRYSVAGTGATEFGVHGSPVEDAAGNLYFGAQDDHVYALGADGQQRWKLRTGADVDAPVVIASDRRLLAASDDGKLYCVVERGPQD